MSLALPINANRRGACPSLDAPMQTGDGLLARLRITDGRLTPAALARLVEIAGNFGNGSVEITARGNLQIRGLTAAGAAPFARSVEAFIGIERGLVVETPPLAGDDGTERADPRPVAAAIRASALPLFAQLGPKVTVVVDGDGLLNLAALKADIRLVALAADSWSVTVGAHHFGATNQPVQVAFAALTLLATQGIFARATDLPHIQLLSAIGHLCTDAAAPRQPATTPVGHHSLDDFEAIGLGLPFGATPWESLAKLAAIAPRHGVGQFRLAPHHTLLAIGARSSLLEDLAGSDFILDPADPRRRISACIGNAGCASGHIAARSVANRLARSLPADTDLHVSGCSKGCAHPRRAALTLVGQPNGYGLVIEGTAGDTPVTLLRADQLESALVGGQG